VHKDVPSSVTTTLKAIAEHKKGVFGPWEKKLTHPAEKEVK
jgi:hypothetical protein